MTRHKFLRSWALLATVLVAGSPTANQAFSYVGQGDRLPEISLPRHGGGQASYLGDGAPQARVFAFVKGEHTRSAELMAELADLIDEFEDRPVSWALVVSDRHGAAWADSVALALPTATVLTDEGDQLYGTLGVALCLSAASPRGCERCPWPRYRWRWGRHWRLRTGRQTHCRPLRR